MKLKKKTSTATNSFSYDERFHCCRWCHYYDSGKCYNKSVANHLADNFTMSVIDIAESGKLSGVIEETIHSCNTKEMVSEMINLLKSWKISDKRIKEFEQTFTDVFNQWADFTLKDELDCAIDTLYQNNVDTDFISDSVEISDPETYYCKEYM